MEEKIPGIIGGMGPEATIDLMQRIIANTPAEDDVDHIRCIVDNNPKIPSRMKHILGEFGENPGHCMAEMGKRLEVYGADFLVIPCNTAHHYYEDVVKAVNIPVVHLIDLVVENVVANNPGLTQIGVLGSTTIVKTRLYQNLFAKRGVEVVYPDESVQEKLFNVIKDIKRGKTGKETREDFSKIGNHLKSKGVHLAILGCTELGIIADDLPILCIDAAEVLAKEVVAVAKNKKLPHVNSLNP
ncbi:MAG: amino acid racemase [Desulforhopalus sp.]